jgi:hypothetical protein
VTNRITDAGAIEARLLELAHTTDAKLTAPALAYFAPCSIEAAQRVFDALSSRGTLTMDVQDDGSIVYDIPGRQKLGAKAHAAAAASPEPPRSALVRAVPRSIVVRQQRSGHPLVAAALSMFLPGAGHLYAGRILAAFMWFMVVGAGYTLLLPGLVLHMFCIASAANSARRYERTQPLLLVG